LTTVHRCPDFRLDVSTKTRLQEVGLAGAAAIPELHVSTKTRLPSSPARLLDQKTPFLGVFFFYIKAIQTQNSGLFRRLNLKAI
jgi:hypothetical protein